MPPGLLRDGHDEARDRGVVDRQLGGAPEHRSILLGERLVLGCGSLELGVQVIDRAAVHIGVQLGLRLDVVVDRTRGDPGVLRDRPVRGGAKTVLGEANPRCMQDLASSLGRIAVAWSAHLAGHGTKVTAALRNRPIGGPLRPEPWHTWTMEQRPADLSDLSLDQLVELERGAEADADGGDGGLGDGGLGDDDLDDFIVLPWWQRPFNIAVLVVTAAIMAGMVGWSIGESDGVPAHNEVDTGFLQDMRVHHEQAVLMSTVYRTLPDIDPGMSTIARSIIMGQNIEIGRMIQMLRTLGEAEANDSGTSMLWMSMVAEANQMPGMASEAELDALARSEGREADILFADLMIEHHFGGIEMADFAVQYAEYDEVVMMAEAMAGGQQAEIREMLDVIDAGQD